MLTSGSEEIGFELQTSRRITDAPEGSKALPSDRPQGGAHNLTIPSTEVR